MAYTTMIFPELVEFCIEKIDKIHSIEEFKGYFNHAITDITEERKRLFSMMGMDGITNIALGQETFYFQLIADHYKAEMSLDFLPSDPSESLRENLKRMAGHKDATETELRLANIRLQLFSSTILSRYGLRYKGKELAKYLDNKYGAAKQRETGAIPGQMLKYWTLEKNEAPYIITLYYQKAYRKHPTNKSRTPAFLSFSISENVSYQ